MRELLVELNNLRAVLDDYEDTFLDEDGFLRLNDALISTYNSLVRYLNK